MSILAVRADARAADEPQSTDKSQSATPPKSTPGETQEAVPPGQEALTSLVWRAPGHRPWDLWLNVLALPERVVELVFMPVGFLVSTVETLRLDKRLGDLLENDAGTIAFTPTIKASFGDGFGAGGGLAFKNLLGGEERFDLGGVVLVNGDLLLELDYQQRLAAMEGRGVRLSTAYEIDRNLPYFGIGNDTQAEDERAIRLDTLGISAELDLHSLGREDWLGHLHVAYRRQTMGPGTDTTAPGLGEIPGDMVAIPVEFNRTLRFARIEFGGIYDTRDTIGRPTKGTLIEVLGSLTTNFSIAGVNATSVRAGVARYLEVLPRQRVLVLGLGGGAAVPLPGDDSVPLHELITLGRQTGLRGYTRARFRDRYGVWASAEYHYVFYEYMATGVTLSNALFVDAGRVAGAVDELDLDGLKWSYGFGLRAAHDSVPIASIFLGFSPEGAELSLLLGKDL